MRILPPPKPLPRNVPTRKLTMRPQRPPDPPPPSVAVEPETIGERIRTLRKSKRMSQGELAELAGMGRTDVTKVECGKQDPKFQTLREIARSLEVTISELLKGLD